MSRTRAATIVVLLYVYALAAFGLWLSGFTEDASATIPECTTTTDCPPDISTPQPPDPPTTRIVQPPPELLTTTEAPQPPSTTTTSTVPRSTTTTVPPVSQPSAPTPGPIPATVLPPQATDLPGAPPALTG